MSANIDITESTTTEPPDKYNCIQLPLKHILPNEQMREILFDAVTRTNKFTIKAYMLIRLLILENYHSNQDIPEIDKDLIITCFQSLNKHSTEASKKKDYYNIFLNLYSIGQEDGSGLVQILNHRSTVILTMFENNIKSHFFDYLKRFVNSVFFDKYKNELENNIISKTDLKKELNKVKNDLINTTDTCDEKYKSWVKDMRYKILPKIKKDNVFGYNYYIDLKSDPQKYIKYMIFMSIEIEKHDNKMFQFCPLQSTAIPTFIDFDSASIADILVTKNYTEIRHNIEANKEKIWSLFNITQTIKSYTFNHSITTNGYSASIRFINNNYLPKKQERQKNCLKVRESLKGLSKEEKKIIKKKKDEEFKEKNKERLKEEITCKCGSVITKANKSSHRKTKKHKIYLRDNDETDDVNVEFKYITEVDKSLLVGKNHVFIDPGKRSYFTMLDDNGRRLSYTNKQHIKRTKRLKYKKKLEKYRDKKNISEDEKILADYSSKTCDLSKFKDYIKIKLEINEKIRERYEDEIFRRHKFYGYINKKRSEQEMLNTIEKRFGKDIIIIIGDWSISKQMRNFISTPNLGLKRRLKERFKHVYNIDEYKTSCLYNKTETKCENKVVKDWYEEKINKQKKYKVFSIEEQEEIQKKIETTKKSRELHSVLTIKIGNRIVCINRDYNACLNMKKIFYYYINTGERPEAYKRTQQQDDLTLIEE
jgi:hypothetical protein